MAAKHNKDNNIYNINIRYHSLYIILYKISSGTLQPIIHNMIGVSESLINIVSHLPSLQSRDSPRPQGLLQGEQRLQEIQKR